MRTTPTSIRETVSTEAVVDHLRAAGHAGVAEADLARHFCDAIGARGTADVAYTHVALSKALAAAEEAGLARRGPDVAGTAHTEPVRSRWSAVD